MNNQQQPQQQPTEGFEAGIARNIASIQQQQAELTNRRREAQEVIQSCDRGIAQADGALAAFQEALRQYKAANAPAAPVPPAPAAPVPQVEQPADAAPPEPPYIPSPPAAHTNLPG